MSFSTWVMIAVIGWTALGLLLVAVLLPRAPWKAVLAWLGIALLPLGIWLVGLTQAAIDGWNTLAAWWQGLNFTVPMTVAGLSVLGFAVALLLLSRLVPTRPRKRRTSDRGAMPPAARPPAPGPPAAGSTGYRQPPQSDQTLILPENRPNY